MACLYGWEKLLGIVIKEWRLAEENGLHLDNNPFLERVFELMDGDVPIASIVYI